MASVIFETLSGVDVALSALFRGPRTGVRCVRRRGGRGGDETAERRGYGMMAVASRRRSRRRGGHGGDGPRFASTRWSQLYFKRLTPSFFALFSHGRTNDVHRHSTCAETVDVARRRVRGNVALGGRHPPTQDAPIRTPARSRTLARSRTSPSASGVVSTN